MCTLSRDISSRGIECKFHLITSLFSLSLQWPSFYLPCKLCACIQDEIIMNEYIVATDYSQRLKLAHNRCLQPMLVCELPGNPHSSLIYSRKWCQSRNFVEKPCRKIMYECIRTKKNICTQTHLNRSCEHDHYSKPNININVL